MIYLSKRAQLLKSSATLEMAQKAKELQAKGQDILNFSQGEPDFDTPSPIKEAAKRALDQGFTKYGPAAGLPELRRSVAEKLKRENGLDYLPEQIVVTCGAKLAVYNALQVLLDPEDEVLIPAPYWVSYPEQVALAGGRPVIIETGRQTGYRLTASQLAKSWTARTRALILNSPANPSGEIYSREELVVIAQVCLERKLPVISDEVYEYWVYDGIQHCSIINAEPDMLRQTILINGASKSFSMTGWRMGYAAGPLEVIQKMTALQGQQLTCIPPFIQLACVEALNGRQELANWQKIFQRRRDLMLKLLTDIEGIKCRKALGAFFLLPDITAFLKRRYGSKVIANASQLALLLLTEGKVAVVSGDPFGAPGHIRLSYATSEENIKEGCARLKNFLLGLK